MIKNAAYMTVEVQTVFFSDDAVTTLDLQLTIPM
jgi:hypothetical protein